jgi:hypothetical protein
MYPLFEALDAEEPTCIAVRIRGEKVCFCPKDDNDWTKSKVPTEKMYSMELTPDKEYFLFWNTMVLIWDTMDIYSSDLSDWGTSASITSSVWSIGCGRTYLLSRLEKRRIRLFLPKRWQIIEQNQRSST